MFTTRAYRRLCVLAPSSKAAQNAALSGERVRAATEPEGKREPHWVMHCYVCSQEYVDVIKRTREEADIQDEVFGFQDFKEGEEKLGWMVTYSQVSRLFSYFS